ncbi:hypothetical protein V490_00248 [Pseudogymnoascus sp. VKM F-3557]|nr:hypothetical protein V490_00248 [Pseudogymnoascus sp. VKM F-3557]
MIQYLRLAMEPTSRDAPEIPRDRKFQSLSVFDQRSIRRGPLIGQKRILLAARLLRYYTVKWRFAVPVSSTVAILDEREDTMHAWRGGRLQNHGGRCSCALKKEHLDPVLESDLNENSTSMVPTTEILLPSTLPASSETSFLISAPSHHVPPPKQTEMAHPWALTYNVPGVDSTQCEHTEMAHLWALTYNVHRVDSTQCAAPPSLSNDSIEHLPYLSTVDTFRGDFGIPNTVINAQMEQTVIDPELGSPDLVNPSNIEPLNSHLPPFDMSSFDSLPSNLGYPFNFDDLDTIHETDQSLVPANCGSISIDWSHYDA